MEIKKNKKINHERLRFPIALMGFLFVGGVLLASFTYKSSLEQEIFAEVKNGSEKVVYVEQANKPEQKEEVPVHVEQMVPPQQKIIIDTIMNDKLPETGVTIPGPPIVIGKPEPPVILPDPIKFPDKEAGFPGGAAELQKWINSNVVYPETAIEMEDQGKVYLSFVVEADGSITNISIEKEVTKELDREAKRLVRSMPKWVPGEVSGKRVRTVCSLPIVFTLE